MKKKIDPLGRVVIPKTVRNDMALNPNDLILIHYDSDKKTITIKKAENRCFVCGGKEDLILLPNHYYLCCSCLRQTKPSLRSEAQIK